MTAGNPGDASATMIYEASRHSVRPPGTTTGTTDRPAQHLAAPIMSFDLSHEVARLRAEPAWQRSDRNAKTLIKEPDFRTVLTVMKAGARQTHHTTNARVTLQVLAGRIRLHIQGTMVDLTKSQVLSIDRAIHHGIDAIDESAFLLTLVWPSHIEAT